MTDTDNRPVGPLARIGQSDSAAGLSRLGIALMTAALGGLIAWGSHDLGVMFDRLNENQRAIIAIGDRMTHVEDKADLALTSSKEFRIWTEGRVNDLTSHLNASDRLIDQIDRKQSEASNRVRCLENKTRCPP